MASKHPATAAPAGTPPARAGSRGAGAATGPGPDQPAQRVEHLPRWARWCASSRRRVR
jgi:hypothetical protein